MTTWTTEHTDQFRSALRPFAEPDDAHERLRRVLARAAALAEANAKPAARSPRTRVQALALVSAAARPRSRPRAADAAVGVERLDLMDEIGEFGITARDFSGRLRAVTAGTIELHISSPGGDVFDGLAMYNELRDHPARVNVVVDGLAASAASFIAMAGDTVTMNRGAQMMVHDAFALTVGNEHDHLRTAELLGRVSDVIAGVYADRAGQDAAHWRDVMRAETWFDPAEAVAAGLADELVEDTPPAVDLAAAIREALR